MKKMINQTNQWQMSRKRIEVENVEATDSKNAIEKVIIHEKEIDTRKRQGSKGRKQPSKNEASEKHQSDQASINKAGRDKLVDEREETADSKSDLGKTNMTEDVIEKTKEQKRDVIEKIHKEVSELMQKNFLANEKGINKTKARSDISTPKSELSEKDNYDVINFEVEKEEQATTKNIIRNTVKTQEEIHTTNMKKNEDLENSSKKEYEEDDQSNKPIANEQNRERLEVE